VCAGRRHERGHPVQAYAQAQAPSRRLPPPRLRRQSRRRQDVEGLTVTGQSQNGLARPSTAAATGSPTTCRPPPARSRRPEEHPAVEVDVQGNVSLRGDTKRHHHDRRQPSGHVQGRERARRCRPAADSVERVEVITNPSAQFSPEGSAGIINLITRRPASPASPPPCAQPRDRTAGQCGVSGAYNYNKLTLSGDSERAARQPGRGAGHGRTEPSWTARAMCSRTSRMVRSQRGDAVLWNGARQR